jgi:hypothetical protein
MGAAYAVSEQWHDVCFSRCIPLHNQTPEPVMKANVGNLDRVVRIVLGLGLLSLTVMGPQTWFGLLGLIPLATATMGFCPLYTLLGLSTCPVKQGA